MISGSGFMFPVLRFRLQHSEFRFKIEGCYTMLHYHLFAELELGFFWGGARGGGGGIFRRFSQRFLPLFLRVQISPFWGL